MPAPGINCLIGPGDSGKSSILDAIDLCVGARRGGTFGDMDFFALNVDVPITISVALGDLPLSLMDIDVYGEFLRGFHPGTGEVEDGSCVSKITKAIQALDQDARVEVDRAAGKVTVESTESAESIRELIQELGYSAQVSA